ncbi:pisatin demethylase [Microdochium trichocladiopsis]|uniref:Pisatin demethylase n=1 Tax=Microdochium trichocladiopsis TaxID=1682393 RepID=A0A9P9BNQ9_9PEZI|nr:pisatin demethylase [Microdochium trichocladiopsis]KAH7021118.1 pisatin demethylase [Microdochium trichocladiopsis]
MSSELISLRILLGLLPVVFLTRFYVRWRRLRHVPGPFWWSITPIPFLVVNLKGISHEAQDDLVRKYGPLVRIGRNTVLTTDHKHCQKMSAHKSNYEKGQWYSSFRFQVGIHHSFSETNEQKHGALRTKIGPGHAATPLENSMDRQLTRMFSLVERDYLNPQHAKPTKRVDLSVLTRSFALDTIGDMTFGAPFGFLDEGVDVFGWFKWNEDFFPVASTCATFPVLGDLFQFWPFSLALPTRKDKVGLGRFIRAAEDSLDSHSQSGALPRQDMIAQFLKNGASRTEAISSALIQVVAGTDSVAVAICMTMLLVFSNPSIHTKLMSELSSAEQAGLISRPLIRDSEARRLPYLQAVIREGIRKFPPLTPLLSKTVPQGGDVVCGHHLPAGTQVGVHVVSIMHSKECWGGDADTFRPERWLEADEATLEDMSTCLEAVFGYGRYKCLGRGVAFMEMNKALPEFLLRYNITFSNPTRPVDVLYSAAFWMMHGLWASISSRV